MSIIYSYPEQGQLNADDMFIGTSAVTVGGKQKNITRNFTVQQIADFINQGTGFVDPLASDFQIPVFNQQGKKITGSIMSQNIYPNGSAITIAGSLTVNTNLTASGNVTLGSGANNIVLQSPTTLGGPITDSANTLGTSNQILISNSLGNLVWQNYEAGLTYEGTWDASTNTPTLTSGQGVSGHFYIVSVAGNTNLDGNNDWHVGDWAVFFDAGGGGAGAWQKIDNTSVLTGSGTANTFAMWTATETLNDSLLSQDAGATKVIVDGLLEIKGDGASQDGRIKLNCSQNSHGVTIQSPSHSAGASYTLILPTSVGTSGQTLTTNGSDPAQLAWTDHSTGTVTGTGTQNYVTKWSAGGIGIEDSTIFDNGTNVGIGTTSPSKKLDIRDSDPSIMVASTNPSGEASLILRALGSNGTSNAYTEIKAIPEGSGTSSALSFDTRDSSGTISEKMRIGSNGNVGIGTASPSGKVHIYDGSSGQSTPNPAANSLILEDDASNGLSILTPDTGIGSIFFGDNSDNFVGGFRYDHSDNSLDVNVNNATALSIDSSRNIGIGTSTPSVSLDISGTDAIQVPVGATGDRPVTGVSDGMFRYNNTSNSFEGYINGNWGAIGGSAGGGLVFRGTFDASTGAITGGGSLYTCPAGGSGGTVDIAVGDLYIVTTAGSFYCSGTNLNVGDEVICITAATAGNSSASDWNAVASGGGLTGSGTINYVPKFTSSTSIGNSNIFEDSSGNAGINTIDPNNNLHVKASSNGKGITIQRGSSSANTYAELSFLNSTNAAAAPTVWVRGNRGSSNANYLTLGTADTEQMRIDADGKVGIGTDAPAVSLDLGNNTDAIRVPNGATADRPSGIFPGMIRYNTTTSEFEGYSGTLNVSGSWGSLGGGVPTITKQLFQVTTAQSIFTLTAGINPQDANYVNIFIDGVYQNSGTYTVATTSGTTTVTLNTAAPVGTSVEIISTT